MQCSEDQNVQKLHQDRGESLLFMHRRLLWLIDYPIDCWKYALVSSGVLKFILTKIGLSDPTRHVLQTLCCRARINL